MLQQLRLILNTIHFQSTENNISIKYANLRSIVLTLRALNHDLRKKIIDLLLEHKEMNVTDIYVKLRIEQSVASQHLAILRKSGIVETNRTGKFIKYTLNHERLATVSRLINKLTY